MYGMWWGSGPWGWGPGWWLLGPLLMLVFWGAVIVLAVGFLRARCSRRAHGPGPDAALEILRARYAKGEITREEFEAMRRDLKEA